MEQVEAADVDGAPVRETLRRRRDRSLRPRSHRLLVLTAAVLCVTQSVAGAWWWVRSWGAIPEYGDTSEYVWQSETLEIDGYRTLAYPLLIRVATHVESWTDVPWNEQISILQLVVSVLAAWYLAAAVAGRARPWWVAAATAAGVCAPLPLHFTHAVLTDSLGASALLIMTGGLVRVVARDERGVLAVSGVVVGAAGSVLLRPDRLYVCAAVALAALVVLAVRRLRHRITGRELLAGTAVVLVGVLLSATAATWLNRETQTADLGRQQQTLAGAAFDRIAYRHLEDIRPLLSDDVAAALPPVPAPSTPAAPAGPALAHLREVGGEPFVRATIVATLRCCAAEVAWEATRDLGLNVLGPYPVAADWVTGHNGSTQWNFSRMRATSPASTDAFMGWSVATTALLLPLTVGVLVAARRRRDVRPWRASALVVVAAVVLALSGVFALVTSLDPNSRYTLAVQSAWWVVPIALLADVRKDR